METTALNLQASYLFSSSKEKVPQPVPQTVYFLNLTTDLTPQLDQHMQKVDRK